MADKYQNAILDSIESIVDSKMKNNGTSYYINGKVIDKNSRLYNVANHQHTCTLQEKGSNNEKCKTCPYNNRYLNDRSRQVRRIYDSENTCVGYYEVVYEDIFARSGLVPTVGDSVQIMVKNGNFSNKFIDDVLEGKGATIGQNGENNDSLLPSIPLNLSIGDVTYNSANVSWTVGEDLKKVLGGYTLVWGNSECPPYPNINQTANFDIGNTSTTIKELNESTTYTAWVIARDLYGKYQKSNNFDCIQTFTTPAKPDVPIDDSKYPTWYNTYRTQYIENEPINEQFDDFTISGNFANDNCVLIENNNFKQLINYYMFYGDTEIDIWGIEFNTTLDLGCLWKDPSRIPYLYVQKGNYTLPSSSVAIDTNTEDYDQDTIDRCCDNYYSKVIYDDSNISKNYEKIDTFNGSNYVYVAVMKSCEYPTDRDQNKETWEPNSRVTSSQNISEYMIFLGVDINGTPNPYKCVVCLAKQSMETFGSLTKEEIKTEQWSPSYNVNKTFTISSYRKE